MTCVDREGSELRVGDYVQTPHIIRNNIVGGRAKIIEIFRDGLFIRVQQQGGRENDHCARLCELIPQDNPVPRK